MITLAVIAHLPFRLFFRKLDIRTFFDTTAKTTVNTTILRHFFGVMVGGGTVLLNTTFSGMGRATVRVPRKRLCNTLRRRTVLISVGRVFN